MKSLRPLLVAAACALPLLAAAQWQWIDKDGRKVFSDRSPPADIPAKNILKQPGPTRGSSVAVPAAAAATPGAEGAAGTAVAASAPAPQAAASAPKLSGKDKELEDKKKQAEAAEAAKKKEAEEKFAQAKAENCTRAKQSKASFDSGVRIARINEKGEKEIMDDAQRASEVRRLDSVIARDCK
jgi:hypothetical protein